MNNLNQIDINFTNPDTKEELTLSTNTNITLIYGGNGTGKTTLSRAFNEEYAVFNRDFVNKNVYITDDLGAKSDVKTKEGFTELFLSEDVVKLADEVVKYKEERNVINRDSMSRINSLNTYLARNNLGEVNVEEIIKEIEYETNFDFNEGLEKNKPNHKLTKKLKTNINNDEQYKQILKAIKEEYLINQLRNRINSSDYLKSLIFNSENYLLEAEVNKYNNSIRDIEAIEKIFNKTGNIADYKKWVGKGVQLHSNINVCLFCGNKNIEKQIKAWRARLNDEKIVIKEELINNLTDKIKELDKITNDEKLFRPIAPKVVVSAIKIQAQLKNNLRNININKTIDLKQIEFNLDQSFKESENNIENAKNYYINNNYVKYFFPYIYLQKLDVEIKSKTIEVSRKNEQYGLKALNKINNVIEKLGLFDKKIQVLTDNRGNRPKLDFSGVDQQLRDFSEGQIHKIAFVVNP